MGGNRFFQWEVNLKQKSVFFLLIGAAALISFYFWGLAARTLLHNQSLNQSILARVIQWEVEEAGRDRFNVKAHYAFEIDGSVYRGSTLFAKPVYLNQATAVAALKEMAVRSEPRTAWYCHKDPTRSSLEKVFPQSLLIRAFTSSGVLLYFIFLRRKNFSFLQK